MSAIPSIIVITGLPASGKTTLGLKVAETFKLPFISKDDIKELLFDCLGSESREDSVHLGKASLEILWYIAESLLRSKRSVIIESNFHPEFSNSRLNTLVQNFKCTVIQVLCTAPRDILIDRFIHRLQSGERHPGHHDQIDRELVEKQFFAKDPIWLGVIGPRIEADTSAVSTFNDSNVLRSLVKIIINCT